MSDAMFQDGLTRSAGAPRLDSAASMYSGLSVERAMRDITDSLPQAAQDSIDIYAGWPQSSVYEELAVCFSMASVRRPGDVHIRRSCHHANAHCSHVYALDDFDLVFAWLLMSIPWRATPSP